MCTYMIKFITIKDNIHTLYSSSPRSMSCAHRTSCIGRSWRFFKAVDFTRTRNCMRDSLSKDIRFVEDRSCEWFVEWSSQVYWRKRHWKELSYLVIFPTNCGNRVITLIPQRAAAPCWTAQTLRLSPLHVHADGSLCLTYNKENCNPRWWVKAMYFSLDVWDSMTLRVGVICWRRRWDSN